MRQVSTDTANAWAAGGYVGGAKVAMRVTLQNLSVMITPYALRDVLNSTRHGTGYYSSIPFNQQATPVELPNLKSVRWDRNVDQDVATCTIEMYNVRPLPPGTPAPNDEDFDQPGFYTFNRGDSGAGNTRWGYEENSWADRIVPDRLVRTFEGYGADYTVPPEEDAHMYPSGLWLIDEVHLSPAGILSIVCRDIGRALLDLIHIPPIVPLKQYPVSWTRFFAVDNPDIVETTTAWFRPKYDTDSNVDYIDRPDITDGGTTYVGPNGGVHGHDGRDAFDGSDNTYFLSVGNRQKWSSAFEYVQGKFSARTIGAVRVKPWAGPYKMYVSVYADGEWKGKRKIPYRYRVVDTHADIPYVSVVHVKAGSDHRVKLPRQYNNATKVRVTFADLYDSGIGVNYRYRAGCYDLEVSGGVEVSRDGGTHLEGDYSDYTDIIKWLLAWGGWFFPGSPSYRFLKYTDGTKHVRDQPQDPVLTRGSIWGNLENTLKNGPATLTVDLFDKKPLMDGISYVKDIIGFNFYIDECGGAVWRAPNIWSVGNNIYPIHGGRVDTPRTTDLLTIDEKTNLMNLGVSIRSTNVREQVFVGDTTGQAGAVSAGYNPYPSGLRRIGGWTDQHFGDGANGDNAKVDKAIEECQIMADLITVRQMFTYRTDNITIPGNPAIQIDDQVRVYERTTGETFIHYVKGVSSEWEAASGQWTYTLETHWLGETPFSHWSFDPAKLKAATKLYLTALGKL